MKLLKSGGGGLVAKLCPTLGIPWTKSPWDSSGKKTGAGCHLLQRIFPIQESNLGLLHCRQMIYQLSYDGSPKNQPLKSDDDQKRLQKERN